MLKMILVGVVVVVAGVLAYAATRPDSFRVERSARIAAPPEKIFPLIEDLHRWQTWSPYEAKDPAMQRTHSGAVSGKGAVYAWDGDKNVGKGLMEIVDTAPPSRVTIKLDFERPFEAHNRVDFTLVPMGADTEVTWAMQGPSPYVSKLMGLFLDFDEMIGRDFAAGLVNLKRLAES